MPEDSDQDAATEAFHDQQLSLMERLAAKFVEHGFECPREFELRRIATLNHYIDSSVLVQDTGSRDGRPNTRAPVERLLAALESAWELYGTCLDVAELESPPGRLNVAREFIESVDVDPLSVGSEIFVLSLLANDALRRGKIPSRREPNYAYDAFIERVWGACGSGTPCDRAKLVSLLYNCEFVLPKSYRGSTRAVVGDRLDAFIGRAPERQKLREQEQEELMNDALGESGVLGLPGATAKE